MARVGIVAWWSQKQSLCLFLGKHQLCGTNVRADESDLSHGGFRRTRSHTGFVHFSMSALPPAACRVSRGQRKTGWFGVDPIRPELIALKLLDLGSKVCQRGRAVDAQFVRLGNPFVRDLGGVAFDLGQHFG